MISDAKASPPFCSVTNSGLMPIGSRASRSRLASLSQIATAIHAFEARPGVVAPAQIGGEDRLGVAMVGLEGVSRRQAPAAARDGCRFRR